MKPLTPEVCKELEKLEISPLLYTYLEVHDLDVDEEIKKLTNKIEDCLKMIKQFQLIKEYGENDD